MKRYLIRAGFDPYTKKKIDPDDDMWQSYVGGNSGNLMFAYGVMNVMQTESTELEFTYKWSFSDKEIEEINAKFDAFIIPMADAFRVRWQKQLSALTDAIEKMKIPVIIIGIAVRADYEPDFSNGFEFDNCAKRFVNAVRKKGTVIGVRGEITGDYLKHLGFKEEIDFTPIGCPSLYTYGSATKTRSISGKVNTICVNTNGYYNVGNINEFLINTIDAFPEISLVQQQQAEYRDLYLKKSWLPLLINNKINKLDKTIINGNRLEVLFKKNKVRYFFDVISWINFMRDFDLFVGNRFHGTVAAVLAGVPHVMVPFNARTRELTEYHQLTCLKPDEIKEGTSVLDYIDRLDFQSFDKHQEENLMHYIRFLEENGLDNIFRKQKAFRFGESVLEQRIQKRIGIPLEDYCRTVNDFESLDWWEKLLRIAMVHVKALRINNIKSIAKKMGED